MWGATEVITQLLKSKGLLVLYYGLDVCQLNRDQVRSLEFAVNSCFKQEGQHPLTGQRAPPISGGTQRRRRTLIDGYLESPFPTACLLSLKWSNLAKQRMALR